MVQSRDCPKCASGMAEGFIPDHTHGAFAVSNWVEGQPNKSIWVGVKLGGKARSQIATWRCRRCGYLESYAVEEPNLAAEAQTRSQARVLFAVLVLVAVGVLALAVGLALAG